MKIVLERFHKFAPIILYLIVLFISAFLLQSFIFINSKNVSNNYLSYTFLSSADYITFWIVPVIFILKYIERINPFEYLKLSSKWRSGVRKGIMFSVIIAAFFILKAYLSGIMNPHINIGAAELIGVLLVGIFEEIPFRGYILQKLNENTGFWIANIITSVLFTIIHIPNWLYAGTGLFSAIYSTFVMSLFFGYIFKTTDSLWSTIIIHSIYNLCIFAIL